MPLLDDQMIWMEARYEELGVACSQSEIIQDLPHWQSLMKERAGLEEAVHDWQQYQQLCDELRQARELLSNPEFADLAQEESLELEEQEKKWCEKLKLYLIPKDPDD